LESLPNVFLGAMLKLAELDLSGNRLISLPGFEYNGGALRRLNLSGNQLAFADNFGFDEMARLQSLDISRNGLRKLPKNMVNKNKKLQHFAGKGNEFRVFPSALNQLLHKKGCYVALDENCFKLSSLKRLRRYSQVSA